MRLRGDGPYFNIVVSSFYVLFDGEKGKRDKQRIYLGTYYAILFTFPYFIFDVVMYSTLSIEYTLPLLWSILFSIELKCFIFIILEHTFCKVKKIYFIIINFLSPLKHHFLQVKKKLNCYIVQPIDFNSTN